MAQPELSQTVVVLDLDDTLYKEADYHDSGLREVCNWIEGLYGRSLAGELEALKSQGERDLLGALCRLAGLPLSVKDSLVWVYRLHEPRIHLSPAAKETIHLLESMCRVAILTDGRSVSQRKKLKSLGLSHLPAYISEEHGSEKPSPLRFELIMRELPALDYVYVADNPSKDFLAPNALNWKTIGLIGDKRNIHSQDRDGLSVAQLPQKWITSLDKLMESLC
ncbi:MAG: HAD family hydrolase [Burkholderiaceae bacterium]|nr:HAD family hydrolase [Burkholderiaceae bacterium]